MDFWEFWFTSGHDLVLKFRFLEKIFIFSLSDIFLQLLKTRFNGPLQ